MVQDLLLLYYIFGPFKYAGPDIFINIYIYIFVPLFIIIYAGPDK
jgi:hypothetical protein